MKEEPLVQDDNSEDSPKRKFLMMIYIHKDKKLDMMEAIKEFIQYTHLSSLFWKILVTKYSQSLLNNKQFLISCTAVAHCKLPLIRNRNALFDRYDSCETHLLVSMMVTVLKDIQALDELKVDTLMNSVKKY